MVSKESPGNSIRSGGGRAAPMTELQKTLVIAGVVVVAMVMGGGLVFLISGGGGSHSQAPDNGTEVAGDPAAQQAAAPAKPAPGAPGAQGGRNGQPAGNAQRGAPAAAKPPAPPPVPSDPYKAAIDARLTQLDKQVGAKTPQSTQQAVDTLKKWVQENPRQVAAVLGEAFAARNIMPRLVKDCKAYQPAIDLIDATTAALNRIDNEPSSSSIVGGIGLAVYDTQSEYRDIRVESSDGSVLYESNFPELGAKGWKPESGNWAVAGDAYRPTASGTFVSYLAEGSWTDCTITLQARKISGKEGFLIVFGHKDHDKLWWNLGGWGNTANGVEFNSMAVDQSGVGAHFPGTIETNRWYDIKVQISGSQISGYLDGKLIEQVSVSRTTMDEPFLRSMRHWKAVSLAETGRADEAADLVKANMAAGWTDGNRILTEIVTPMANKKSYAQVLTVTQSIMLANPDNNALVESSLNQRINALSASQKHAEALAEAKVLFNYATMEHTADALKTLDREIQAVNASNRAQVDLFHKEEEQGAAVPTAGQTFKSTVLAGITVDGLAYGMQAQATMGTGYRALIKRGSLLLLGDHGDQAAEFFKQALTAAGTPEEKQAANMWIARAIKAQDGTIGRANQWITSVGK